MDCKIEITRLMSVMRAPLRGVIDRRNHAIKGGDLFGACKRRS
jgi:hypothetical protein